MSRRKHITFAAAIFLFNNYLRLMTTPAVLPYKDCISSLFLSVSNSTFFINLVN